MTHTITTSQETRTGDGPDVGPDASTPGTWGHPDGMRMPAPGLLPLAHRLMKETGLTQRPLAMRAGCSRNTLGPRVLRQRTRHVSAVVGLAIDLLGLPGADALGARRRLQALAAFGWDMPAIGQEIARPTRDLTRIRDARDLIVPLDLDRDIRAIYGDVCEIHGGSLTAETIAYRNWWPSPTWWEMDTEGTWDMDTGKLLLSPGAHFIDNPTAIPAPGWHTQLPLASGGKPARTCIRSAVRVEQAMEIARTEGGSLRQIAERMGTTRDALQAACRRVGISSLEITRVSALAA